MELLIGVFLIMGILFFMSSVDIAPLLRFGAIIYLLWQAVLWFEYGDLDAQAKLMLFTPFVVLWFAIEWAIKRRRKHRNAKQEA